jgi:putative hydrolase of the HAD superfamily
LAGTSRRGFERTQVWIFDLDNTLYPAHCNLFAQVDRRMGEFIARFLGVPLEYARHLQKSYYRQFGTTLCGLMQVHRMDPTPFLDYVHDLDLSVLPQSPELAAAIARLPGRKLILTNGSRAHAERVAGKLGILDLFEDIFDICAADYTPKPSAECTVLVHSDCTYDHPVQQKIRAWTAPPEHVHHMTDDLARFLQALAPLGQASLNGSAPPTAT